MPSPTIPFDQFDSFVDIPKYYEGMFVKRENKKLTERTENQSKDVRRKEKEKDERKQEKKGKTKDKHKIFSIFFFFFLCCLFVFLLSFFNLFFRIG